MTASSGASSHFIDNQLLPGIEHKNEPLRTAGPSCNNRRSRKPSPLWRWLRGLVVHVIDHIGSKHSVQHSVTTVPELGRHLFSGGSAASYERGHYDHRQKFVFGHGCIYCTPTQRQPMLHSASFFSTSPLVLQAEHLRQLSRPYPAADLSRKPSSLFTLRLLLKLLPCLHPIQLTSGI